MIKYDDVLEIAQNLKDEDGLIVKKDFQLKIALLRDKKKPAPKKEKRPRINHAREIIGNIIKYQNQGKSNELKKMLYQKVSKDYEIKLPITRIFEKRTTISEEGQEIVEEIDFPTTEWAYSRKQLKEILKISEPTYKRFVKLGILATPKPPKHLFCYVDPEIKFYFTLSDGRTQEIFMWNCYSLMAIRKKLNNYK